MSIADLSELRSLLAPGSRLLGLDLGEKTIGLALSDTTLSVATPMETLKRGKFSADALVLEKIIADQGVGGLVIGLPLNMDGSDGPSAQSARAFARNFAMRSALPIVLCDERLSTAAVTRTLLEADASRQRRAALVDKMAAAYILQGALDRMRHLGKMNATADDRPAKIGWLPPGLRPPGGMTIRQERVFLLVGLAALFAGYDMNVFGMAIPQIQASLHIPEDKVGLTVSFFRLAAIAAMLLAWSADLVGRRRLLLFTIFGQAVATLGTGFAQNYEQFVWLQIATRIFGYAEEMLCFVVIAEEVAAAARGWANGTLAAMNYAGAGLASVVFATITFLPGGWRGMYVIGSLPLFLVAYLRRRLPETRRFEAREKEVEKLSSRIATALEMTRRLAHEHPRRLATILIAVAGFGFAIWPAVVLGPKYLQDALHFTPLQTTLLIVPGGLVAVVFNILAGRLSDRIGRRRVVFGACFVAMACYGTFYSGVAWPYVAYMWVPGFFGFLCADSLIAGLSAEIFPTAYRATVSGLRYVVGILSGAVALALEGPLYDLFHAHGPALIILMAAMPIAMIAVLRLPEPAGRTLEDIAAEPDRK